MQPVQSPQAQLEVQVRFWHVPQPSVVVAPMAQTGLPSSSQPSERRPLQSEYPGSQPQKPVVQRELAPQLLPQEPQLAVEE